MILFPGLDNLTNVWPTSSLCNSQLCLNVYLNTGMLAADSRVYRCALVEWIFLKGLKT